MEQGGVPHTIMRIRPARVVSNSTDYVASGKLAFLFLQEQVGVNEISLFLFLTKTNGCN